MINLLDSSIYNRIAAGEVVERPSSVVKELIENAIDAGAQHITIEICGGGIDKIRIIDDGAGISRDELKKAFLPHATSKIAKVEDLDNIATLGFRGEALASIASVAKVTVMSKPHNQSEGGKLHIEGGIFGETGYCSCISGTEMVIENLFFNTPARAKFLKKPKSEENDITDVVSRLMMANPKVAFSYSTDTKKQIVDFGLGLEDAILGVYGKDFIKEMIYISSEYNGIKLYGYVSKPDFTKANRTYQTVMVNGRYVVNQTISTAIANAYQYVLVKRLYPAAVLFIEVSDTEVDVNVHPSKTDVKFLVPKDIYDIIYHAIKDKLNEQILGGAANSFKDSQTEEYFQPQQETQNLNENGNFFGNKLLDTEKDYPTLEEKSQDSQLFLNDDEEERNEMLPAMFRKKIVAEDNADKPNPFFKEEGLKDVYKGFCKTCDGGYIGGFMDKKSYGTDDPVEFYDNSLKEYQENEKITQEILDAADCAEEKAQETITETSSGYVILGQVFQTYLFLEFSDYMMIIDQHAAHERLLFDDFMSKIKSKLLVSQPLLFPEIINTNPREYEFMRSRIDYLKDIGMEIEEFGGGSFKVSALPLEIASINLKKFFDDIFKDMNELKVESIPDVLRTELAKKACKAAIKAGNFLSTDEIRALVELLKGNFSLRCPHGRPIAVKIEKTEIEKWFKRIV